MAYYRQGDFQFTVHNVSLYPSATFPTVTVAGDGTASAKVDAVWWEFLEQRLDGFWSRNKVDGTVLGPTTGHRDYYVNAIPCPYTETRVDDSIRLVIVIIVIVAGI